MGIGSLTMELDGHMHHAELIKRSGEEGNSSCLPTSQACVDRGLVDPSFRALSRAFLGSYERILTAENVPCIKWGRGEESH